MQNKSNRTVNFEAVQRRKEKQAMRLKQACRIDEVDSNHGGIDFRIRDELERAGVCTARFAEIFG